jgi:CheY-like chemotaxis protein
MFSDKSTASVLLVNHSAHAQQVAREVALRKGYVAHTAGNAFEALFQLGASRIDAVVCEANLPGRNSQWLHERITQLHPGTLFLVSPSGTGAEWENAVEQLRPVAPPALPVTTPMAPALDVASNEPAALQELDLSDGGTLEEVNIETVDVADAQAAAAGSDADLEAEEVPGNDRRRTARYRPNSRLPVLLRGGKEGLLRDLSVGGALIETDAHVGPHRVFELKVGEANDMVRALVQVVRCDVVGVSGSGITYRVGVAFKSPLNESDVKKLLQRGTA